MMTFLRVACVLMTVATVVYLAAGLYVGAIILAAGASNVAIFPGVFTRA